MAKSTERVIRQIMTAAEWSAFYLLPAEPFYSLRRLICWQLEDVGKDGESEIIGIVAGRGKIATERAPDIEGFHSYIHEQNVTAGDLRPIIGEHRKKLGG
jgi:hypothetical protein